MALRNSHERSHSHTPAKQYYKDQLFPDAVEVTLESLIVSAGRLQSSLRIGSIRATNLLAELEEQGIIGPDRRNRPREIFYTKEQWEKEKHNFLWNPELQNPSSAHTAFDKQSYCPSCGSRVPSSAYVCWRCGKKLPISDKQHRKNMRAIPFLIFFIILLLFFIPVKHDAPAPVMSKSEYISQCRQIPYEKLCRNPDSYKGAYLTFVGEVVQVMEHGSSVHLRVNVTEVKTNGYSYSTDTIYVITSLHEDGNRILEKDIVRLYGQSEGLRTYQAVLGNTVSIPSLKAEYWELIK